MKKENGSSIIEASIVFPMVFVLVFILIALGNGYYQKCKVEAIVDANAIECAAYAQDTLLQYLKENGKVPTNVENMPSLEPYKYLFQGADSNTRARIAETETNIKKQINKLDGGIFSSMTVEIKDCKVVYENYFLYQTVKTNVICYVKLPFRMLGSNESLEYYFSVVNEIPVSDSPEFIRNVDMVVDYLQKYGVTEQLNKAMEQVKTYFKR